MGTTAIMGTLTDWLTDLCTRVLLGVCVACSRARAWLGWTGDRRRCGNRLAVSRVYVFRDDGNHASDTDGNKTETDKTEEDIIEEEDVVEEEDVIEEDTPVQGVHVCDEHHFHELPARFFSPDTWEADAMDATGWGRVRLEVRYTMAGCKYRMVLRPGDVCVFPPPPRRATSMGFPLAVLTAMLEDHDGTTDVDVTTRVLKYAGPNRDFHGTRVRVRDLFPFDDHDDAFLRTPFLKVFDTLARTTKIPYMSEDHVLHAPWGSHANTGSSQMPGLASMNGSVANCSVRG